MALLAKNLHQYTDSAPPPSQPRMYLAEDDIELAPLPLALHPLPLYEEHERDVWLPNNLELEKHDDRHHYPKRVE